MYDYNLIFAIINGLENAKSYALHTSLLNGDTRMLFS
jgi:hypothetical protein